MSDNCFSHCSHQHPHSQDHNHLHLIKPVYICSLSTLPPCPVYRSHTWSKPDPLYLPVCFPYLRRSCFSTPPILHRSSCSTYLLLERNVVFMAQPSGSCLIVHYSPLVTSCLSPLSLSINTLVLTTYLCLLACVVTLNRVLRSLYGPHVLVWRCMYYKYNLCIYIVLYYLTFVLN